MPHNSDCALYNAPADFVGPCDCGSNFRADLAAVINRHSRENKSNTPDFILAEYMAACLSAFEAAVVSRHSWNTLGPVPLAGPGVDARKARRDQD